jgi:hypothetical protein
MEKLTVINDARARQVAESHAEAERFRCERLSDQVQSIKGNVRVFARVRRLPHTSFTFDGSGPALSQRDRTDPPHLRVSKMSVPRAREFRGAAVSPCPPTVLTAPPRRRTCSYPEEDSLSIVDPDTAQGMMRAQRKQYTFDRVFPQDSSQTQVYRDVRPLVMSALEGFNVCILAYGQTGSGKTHTMQGSESEPGVTLRALRDLFQQSARSDASEYEFTISVRRAAPRRAPRPATPAPRRTGCGAQPAGGSEHAIRAQVLEVYNERAFDLLTDPRTAEARRANRSAPAPPPAPAAAPPPAVPPLW